MKKVKIKNKISTDFVIKKSKDFIFNLILYMILIGLAFIFLYPFIYMLVTAFKTYDDVMNIAIKWIPKEATVENWSLAFNTLNFSKTFINSLFVTLISTFGHLFSCSITAYGFSRFEFKGSKFLFGIVIFSIVVPAQLLSVPLYILFSNLGWIGSYLPMTVPTFLGMGLNGGLFIFLFRQYFLQLPKSLEEAAAIDGCNEYGAFFKIILPSTGSTMLVAFVLSIVWHWNDYFEPTLYITDKKNFLLPQMLPSMYDFLKKLDINTTQESINMAMKYHTGVVMAGTLLCVIPLLIVFLFLQNKFIRGVERTGLVE